MKHTKKTFFRYWMPLLVYCLLVYIQSSIPVPAAAGIRHADKLLHFCVYALLGILVFRALATLPTGTNLGLTMLFTIGISALIGIGDEFHQVFVPSRTIDREDFLYDMLGTAAGVALCLVIYSKRRFNEKNKSDQPDP